MQPPHVRNAGRSVADGRPSHEARPGAAAEDGETSSSARGRVLRRDVAIAAHAGDVQTLRRAMDDDDGAIRATALRGLARVGVLEPEDLLVAVGVSDGRVQHAAIELSSVHHRGTTAIDDALLRICSDPDDTLAEHAAWALGERFGADDRLDTGGVPDAAQPTESVVARLSEMATAHPDSLCREAAVAALGAIGHPDGLAAVLTATADKATVRRRAVIALAAFAGDARDHALGAARDDRDWQVRQAAEDIIAAGTASTNDNTNTTSTTTTTNLDSDLDTVGGKVQP